MVATVDKDARRRGRGPLQARARAIVLGALAWFVLAQFGLRGLIDVVRPELRDPTFEIKYRRFNELQRDHAPAVASVIFMGSSMTVFGADAGAIDEPASRALGRPVVGYNLGVAGSGPFTQLLFLRRLLSRGSKPNYVVLELSALCFSEDDPFAELSRLPGPMLSRRDLRTVRRYANDPDQVRRDWLEAYLVPIHGHRLTLVSQTAQIFVPAADRLELWEDIDAHGFRALPAASKQEHDQVLERVRQTFQPQMARFKPGQRQARALRELTDLLTQEGIPTLMVWMPEGPLMRSFYPAERIKDLRDDFELVSRAHGFPMVDARAWLDESMFCDSVHMIDQGGRAFTARLLEEHLLPWLTVQNQSDPPK